MADVPAPFRGNAIALITAGLMSLAFMGFSGFSEVVMNAIWIAVAAVSLLGWRLAPFWVIPPAVLRWKTIQSLRN